jgi:hypothetical protein
VRYARTLMEIIIFYVSVPPGKVMDRSSNYAMAM